MLTAHEQAIFVAAWNRLTFAQQKDAYRRIMLHERRAKA